MTLVFKIGGTDYGPSGLNLVQTFNPGLSGPGRVGQGTVTLLQAAGGATILPLMEVQAYEWNGSQVTAVYFGGFIGKSDTDELPAPPPNSVKTWSLPLIDYNHLLKRLVGKAAWAQAIRVNGTSYPHFAQQVAQVVSQLTTGAAKSIDAVSFVADLVTAGMPTQFFQGKSLQNMLTKLGTDARQLNSALRPAWYIGPDTTLPRASFGGPCLFVYDAALTPPPVMSLSDNPTGAQKKILRMDGHPRSLDAASLVNWQQGVHQATGAIYTASVAGSIGTYGNPYDPDGAWKEEPLTTTEATAGPVFQAKLNAQVAATAYPRETLTLRTDAVPPPLPGQVVNVTLSLEGLSATPYLVAATGVEFPDGAVSGIVRSRLELGLPRLQLGDDPATGATAPPIVIDTIPPDTPGSFTLASNSFNYTTGQADLTFTWAASTAGDLDPTNSYLLEVLVNGVRQRIITAALTATISMAPGATYAAAISSKDTSNNYSAPSTTLTGTAVVGSVPSAPTWPVGWNPENAYDPATNTTRVRVTWNANAAGEHVLQYRAVVVDTASKNRQYLLDGGTTELLLPDEQPGVFRAFKLYATNIVGTSSLSATQTLTTADTPGVGIGPKNPSFEVPTTDDATLPDGWDIVLSGAGTAAARTQAGGATDGQWALSLTGPTVSGSALARSQAFGTAGTGQKFHVQFDYKIPVGGALTVAVDGYDSSGAGVGTIASYSLSSTGGAWTHYDATISISGGVATAASMKIRCLNGTAGTTSYLDNFHVDLVSGTLDIADGAITTAKIAAGAVTSTELATAAVTNAKLQYGTPVAQSGTTASRPGSPVTGQTYLDTTLGIPIWWTGVKWINASGTAV